MEMSGKVAVITGGTSGIGRSTAEKLLERGAAVLILGRDRERGAEMERLGDCHVYPCDMACPEEIAKTCDAILRDYPEIDILVNNAGMSIDGTVETLSLEEWNRIFAVNVTSVYLMSKHLIPAASSTSPPPWERWAHRDWTPMPLPRERSSSSPEAWRRTTLRRGYWSTRSAPEGPLHL